MDAPTPPAPSAPSAPPAITSQPGLDTAAREREYSPSSCIAGNYQPYLQAYAERSRAAHSLPASQRDLCYGAPHQRLDLFVPADTGARPGGRAPPLLVFIHGGYWQELSKDDSAFAAVDCMGHGIAFAALDYTLAPRAGIADMVAECRAATSWLQRHATARGFDAQRIVLAGSSAGAHLAAMAALPEAHAPTAPGSGGTRDTNAVKAVVLISGIYELEPLVGTSINTALGLTGESARALSPAVRSLAGFPPSIVCWGGVETSEFKRQSRDFAARLVHTGASCQSFEVPRRNHFDIVFDLADAATALGRATLELVQSV